MMKILTKIILVASTAILIACSDGGGTVESVDRIQFETGGVEANITGQLAGFDEEKEYVIAVNAGQTMTVKQLDIGEKRITLSILAPNGENVTDMDAGCNGNKTITPTVKGDYKIIAFECMKADPWVGEFTLNVNVK